MTCSAEIFQKKVSDILKGIPGTKNISDDIYIGGRETAEHDERLELVLKALMENGLTINLAKCQFRVPQITFFGHVFSKDGISPDPDKVAVIQNAKPPEDATEMHSFLSSVSFLARFIPDFSTIVYPLRKITHKENQWQWTDAEQQSFDHLKKSLSECQTLAYFDPAKPTKLYVDAGPVGLGAVLTQRDAERDSDVPLYYASRTLTPTEQRYSQIE